MRPALVVLVSTMLMLGWCEQCPVTPVPQDGTVPGKTELRPGESVSFPKLNYLVKFNGITADSRCPIGAMCVWAGDAAAWLSIRGREAVDCTLHTMLEPKLIKLEAMTVRLDTVAPYPYMGERIDSLKYRITLEFLDPSGSPIK